MRYVTLDTETTGLNSKGNVCLNHRIIELACVEIIDGRITENTFHTYLNPGVSISPKATKIHGIKNKSLKGKPKFSDIVKDFLSFIGTSHVIIHNAPFDIAFLDQEFSLLPKTKRPTNTFYYIDTLDIGRELFPGQDNTLDALYNRFFYDENDGVKRIHGALQDAKMLANVFLRLI